MACGVVVLFDVFLEGFRQAEVRHGEFGGEERCGHIEVAVFDLDQQARVGDHGLGQVAFDVGSAGKEAGAGRFCWRVQFQVAAAAVGVVVDLVAAEFQLVVIVGVDERGERASDCGTFRIALGILFEQIVSVAGETRVDAPGGQPSGCAAARR